MGVYVHVHGNHGVHAASLVGEVHNRDSENVWILGQDKAVAQVLMNRVDNAMCRLVEVRIQQNTYH